MRTSLALMFWLLLFPGVSLPGQESIQPQAKLVRKVFKRGDFISVAQEAALDLKDQASGKEDMVAVRICSQEPMPLALSMAAVNPFSMLSYFDHYNFSRERVLFLRSEDCIGDDPAITVTEFWIIPKGAALPPSVESIKSCQAQYELVGDQSPIENEHIFRASLQKFGSKLRIRSEAVGIIGGYYYKRPSPIMKRKLREAQKFLEQMGLTRDRYFTSLQQWPGEYDENSAEHEPQYPEMEIIDISKECRFK
jgi:hypothetical protein